MPTRPSQTADPRRRDRATARAFTLVEVLIVVIILGVLASIALPRFADATDGSRQTAFVTDLHNFNKAANIYTHENGQYLEDSSTGAVPTGFENYINVEGWTRDTPIGGRWDAEQNSYGFTSSIGVHFDNAAQARDDTYMSQIDAMIDDGNLATGAFQKLDADRYYMIVVR